MFDELKSKIKGEILTDEASLNHYAVDGSVFKVKPAAVLLPKEEDDIILAVKYVTRKRTHENNPLFSITARGKATDQAGGPLNQGLIVRFPGYLDKILEIGPDFVRVQPGAIFGQVNEELKKLSRFIPCYPASANFASMGGCIANNCSGEKTLKYGSMKDYIQELKIVSTYGEVITLKENTFAEFMNKTRLFTFEGELYRKLREIYFETIENFVFLKNSKPKVKKFSTGYNIWEVLSQKNGEQYIDATRLFSGSQGTLGILLEAKIKTIPLPPFSGLLLLYFDSLIKSGQVVAQIMQNLNPSALEMVDKYLIEMVKKEAPEKIEGLIEDKIPEIVLLAEFDGEENQVRQDIQKAKVLVKNLTYLQKEAYDKEEQDKLWQIRRSAAVVAEGAQGVKKALPFIEDTAVPPEKMPEYVSFLYDLLNQISVGFSVWGHAGNGNIHIQPFLNIADQNDREKLMFIAERVYKKVLELGGVLSAEHNDGIMRTPFLKNEFEPQVLKIFGKVKIAFDPLNIFNPGKKIGLDINFLKSHFRDEYEAGLGPTSTATNSRIAPVS